MKAINGKKKQSQNQFQRQRLALLAMVHIAPKELGMSDDAYQDILRNEFGVASSSVLSLDELRELVDFFKAKGWKPKQRRGGGQVRALRERAETLSHKIENGEQRLAGLCKKICGVEKLAWCHDIQKLKTLLAALGQIAAKAEAENRGAGEAGQ